MSKRTVEVVRVGAIDRDIAYPGKQVVRLRDLSELYEGKPVKNLEELHRSIRGKRLSGINIDAWDQISGAYLGSHNTDEHGTLILPTDRKFVEVLQWQLRGGGYSDAFNGERAAGMPGLLYYFPCNEGGRSTTISSFPGVSGQQAEWKGTWYDEGFYNRPALKCNGIDPLTALGADPQGQRSFQYLWYCDSPSTDYDIFSYSGTASMLGNGIFNLKVASGKLQGSLNGVNVDPVSGETELQAETWYLIQINTTMWERMDTSTADKLIKYFLSMDVYLGGTLELSVSTETFVALQNDLPISNIVGFGGNNKDGLDEIRHLDRELYELEIADYAAFLKNGRIQGKSKGELGELGW